MIFVQSFCKYLSILNAAAVNMMKISACLTEKPYLRAVLSFTADISDGYWKTKDNKNVHDKGSPFFLFFVCEV